MSLYSKNEKNYLVLYGGANYENFEIFSDINLYQIETKFWFQCHNLSSNFIQPRLTPGVCFNDNKVYIFGGYYLDKDYEKGYFNDLYEVCYMQLCIGIIQPDYLKRPSLCKVTCTQAWLTPLICWVTYSCKALTALLFANALLQVWFWSVYNHKSRQKTEQTVNTMAVDLWWVETLWREAKISYTFKWHVVVFIAWHEMENHRVDITKLTQTQGKLYCPARQGQQHWKNICVRWPCRSWYCLQWPLCPQNQSQCNHPRVTNPSVTT